MWCIPTLFKASPFLLPFVERGNQKVITNYEIVVSRGDSWSRGQRGQILIGRTVFVGGTLPPRTLCPILGSHPIHQQNSDPTPSCIFWKVLSHPLKEGGGRTMRSLF